MMVHTKKLKFKYNNIDFEAKVTYCDEAHKNALKNSENIFYRILLLKPIVLECGGETLRVNNWLHALALSRTKCGEKQYDYDENTNLQVSENKINLYSLAVENIIYYYFNRAKIAYYRTKVDKLKLDIDHKYHIKLEEFREEKSKLKRELKSKVIDAKCYQKLLTPIQKNKLNLEFKILDLKESVCKKYFECGVLRDDFRDEIYRMKR